MWILRQSYWAVNVLCSWSRCCREPRGALNQVINLTVHLVFMNFLHYFLDDLNKFGRFVIKKKNFVKNSNTGYILKKELVLWREKVWSGKKGKGVLFGTLCTWEAYSRKWNRRLRKAALFASRELFPFPYERFRREKNRLGQRRRKQAVGGRRWGVHREGWLVWCAPLSPSLAISPTYHPSFPLYSSTLPFSTHLYSHPSSFPLFSSPPESFSPFSRLSIGSASRGFSSPSFPTHPCLSISPPNPSPFSPPQHFLPNYMNTLLL